MSEFREIVYQDAKSENNDGRVWKVWDFDD